jgi:hypothetical protein
MQQTLHGVIRKGKIEIAEKVPLPENASVLVTIVETKAPAKIDWQAELEAMHTRLRQTGYKPPTAEEVKHYLNEERASWEV